MKSINDKIDSLFENFYPNLGTISSIDPLSLQENSETHKIVTNKGKYVFHHNKFDNKKRIEKMCQILNEISKNDSKTVQFIEMNYNDFSKNSCYLTNFVEGKKFHGTKKEFLNLSKNLFNLHKKLNDITFHYPFYPNRKNYALLQGNDILILKRKLSKIDHRSKNENVLIKNFRIIENEIQQTLSYVQKDTSQKQLIHFDLHPGNVLFKNNNVNVFLDFNSMRYGHILEDVVFCGFRFAYNMTKQPKSIFNLIILFLKNYDENLDYVVSDLKFFLTRCILNRICFILRKKFFQHSDLWFDNLSSQINYLKLTKKIFS
jgi:Ser/Thr protein kinase RdoA (MazF antagonist)